MDSNFSVVLVSLGFFLIFIPKLDPSHESGRFRWAALGGQTHSLGQKGRGRCTATAPHEKLEIGAAAGGDGWLGRSDRLDVERTMRPSVALSMVKQADIFAP